MSTQIVSPRPEARAILLIGLLCAVAGSVDAVAYLLCGRVFVAGMSGATVLFSISLAQLKMGEAALRGGLVVAFFAGVVVARHLARIAGTQLTKKQHISVLTVESIVLLVLAWKSAGAHTYPLLLLLAGVLGVQNGSFRYIGGVRLNTTFISGDLELLGESIMEPNASSRKMTAFLFSWVGYAGGALLGAVGAIDLPRHGFLVPMILAIASIAAVTLMPDQP